MSSLVLSENTQLAIPGILRHITAVLVVIIDEGGNVIDANRGFLNLAKLNAMPEKTWNIRSLFIQPQFNELFSASATQPDIPTYHGIVTLGDSNAVCHSVTGSVYCYRHYRMLVAEYDIADLENLNAAVLELNNELAQTQRDLVKTNRALKRSEQNIKKLMLTDPLTEIPNRRHFDQKIIEEIARSQRHQQPLSYIIADIDHFKSVNDTFGHDVGDKVIRTFAHTIRDAIRSSDFVARIGGEEFVILLPHTMAEQACHVADKIRELFLSVKFDEINHSVSASFGITQLLTPDKIPDLMKRADDALYQAKEAGRNTVKKL